MELSNVGAQPLDITGLNIQPAGQSPFSLAPANNCTVVQLATTLTAVNYSSCIVSVEFTPNGPGPVVRTATLVIDSTDPNGQKQVKLSGEIAQPFIIVNPSSIEFGHVYVGDPALGVDGTVNVTNVGSADLVISTANITNGSQNPSDFSFVPGASSAVPCTVKAGSGPGCTFQVRFVPHGTGDRTAELKLTTNPPDNRNIIQHGIGDLALPLPTPPPIGPQPTCCSAPPFRQRPARRRLRDGGAAVVHRSRQVPAANNSRHPRLRLGQSGSAVHSPAHSRDRGFVRHPGPGRAGDHGARPRTAGHAQRDPQQQDHRYDHRAGQHAGQLAVGLATIAIPPALIPTAIFFPGVAPIGSAPAPLTNILAIAADAGNSGACIAVAWARLRIERCRPS